jgi:diacylglycerol kinase (ATP)
MSEHKRIAFVVNPSSGPRKTEDIARIISENMSGKVPYDILIWKDKDRFDEIREQLISGKYSMVVAVGGDGTVNEVAKNLMHTNIALGIIPRGSGNGLSRSLGIPQNAPEAIKRIETGIVRTIDSGSINGNFFLCTAGIGFDAHIGSLFAGNTKRGLSSYIKITISQFLSYRPKEYTIELNNETIKIKAFLITFANAGQYGNDFYIAPQAKLDDGLLHMVVLKPINLFSVIGLLVKILQRKAHLSKNILTYTSDTIKIKNLATESIHFDGEPGVIKDELLVSIKPHSLKVVC